MNRKALIALTAIMLTLGCTTKTKNTVKLEGVEVREYRGEKLSSVNDFRENSIKGPQYINLSDYALEVSGLVDEPKKMNYDEVLDRQRYSKVVKLDCVEGWSATILWEGVLVRDLIAEAGVKPEANTLIFYAYDGYSTSLPLSYFLDNDILLAYGMNNVTLPAERGFPFQLVAEDKWGYKWIKWVTRIEVSGDTGYRGFWEERGYNQDGSLSGPKFE